MKKYNITYETVNKINSKYYLGAHSTNNLDDGYIGSGKLIKRAILKYQNKNFNRTITGVWKTKEIMFLMESWIVDDVVVSDKLSYNLKGGGFGGGFWDGPMKWTDELLREEAKKYDCRSEFRKKSSGAYEASRNRGLLENICIHMKSPQRTLKWTENALYKEAKKYKTKTEFQSLSSVAYVTAHRRGLLEKICKHMKQNTQWTKELVIEEISKYEFLTDFINESGRAYQLSIKWNLKELKNLKRKVRPKFTIESLKLIGKKYLTVTDFQTNDESAYNAMIKFGGWKVISPHLKYSRIPKSF